MTVNTKITEINDKSATVAWSPLKDFADVIALGTKDSGGVGFDDYGGELDLYDFQLAETTPKLLHTVKTATRFGSLAWSNNLIVGGMTDGTVFVWDAVKLLKGEEGLIATIKEHSSEVKSVKFSSLQPHMLASGSTDGTVLVTDLSAPAQPASYKLDGQSSPVTNLAWNTQVDHILASSHSDGLVAVWDLNKRQTWCQMRAEPLSDLVWNPTEGLHLLTASMDDRNPIMKLWDLRASTSMPLATISGHQQGILGVAWCPYDETLIVSTGKDNRTILWDLYTLQPIADIPNDQAETLNEDSASNIYGAVASSQQKRYAVVWSPLKRGVLATCSFDRKIQAHSVNALATKCGRPPKWLKPAGGVSCSFGGLVVSFADKTVKVDTVVEQPQLVEASLGFESALASTDTISFCKSMASTEASPTEKNIWSFMAVIFETNARSQLLEHLGFHPETIANAAQEYTENEAEGTEKTSMNGGGGSGGGMSKSTERAVQDALVVGNFEAAVECCFRTGNMADALILASCGGAELWQKTQVRYFRSETPKKSFLGVVGAVISNQLEQLVAESDVSKWEETLAILSTYGKSEEFPALCIALGDRLEAAGDSQNASLCYMCSLSLEKAVAYWKSQLLSAKKDDDAEVDLLALHQFVVKVAVFQKANPSAALDPEVADLFLKYATALAEQGLLVTAAKYCHAGAELKDRLYRSRESPSCLAAMGNQPPEFPFVMTQVRKAPARPQNYGNQRHQQRLQPSVGAQQRQPTGHVMQQQVQQAPVAAPAPAPATDPNALPAGWIALQDPSSGRTYYANQSTGQTTWEKPAMAPAPAPAPVLQAAPEPVAPSLPQSNGTSMKTPSKLASKYGDGFVTSASHPQLAAQYGNVGTSGAYLGATRPGTAAAVVKGSSGVAKAPPSGQFDLSTAEFTAEQEPIKQCLMGLISTLQGVQLYPADKKQLAEGEKGVTVLLKRLNRGTIDGDVLAKVAEMVTALNNRDYVSASSIQTGLVSSDWKDHKDWLKGTRFLLQLASKKLAYSN